MRRRAVILVDITQFLGPVGLAVKRGEAWINAWVRGSGSRLTAVSD